MSRHFGLMVCTSVFRTAQDGAGFSGSGLLLPLGVFRPFPAILCPGGCWCIVFWGVSGGLGEIRLRLKELSAFEWWSGLFPLVENRLSCVLDSTIEVSCVLNSTIDESCVLNSTIDVSCDLSSTTDVSCVLNCAIHVSCVLSSTIEVSCILNCAIHVSCVLNSTIDVSCVLNSTINVSCVWNSTINVSCV